jgi:hypothetical protein
VPVRTSLKIIACIYALLGAAAALLWLYAVLRSDPMEGILGGPWFLGLAYGLVTFRPWARDLGLLTSGLLGVMGVISLIRWWQVHAPGGLKDAQGLIIERPIAALFLIAFSAWQWWVFSRPQVRHLYSSKSA